MRLLGGWELSGITTYAAGNPLTVTTGSVDPAGLGFLGASASGPRPDMIADPNANAPHTFNQWFNTSVFTNVPAGVIRPGTRVVAWCSDLALGDGIWLWKGTSRFTKTSNSSSEQRCSIFLIILIRSGEIPRASTLIMGRSRARAIRGWFNSD